MQQLFSKNFIIFFDGLKRGFKAGFSSENPKNCFRGETQRKIVIPGGAKQNYHSKRNSANLS